MDCRRELPRRLAVTFTIGVIFASCHAASSFAEPDVPTRACNPILENLRHDAALFDVCFVDLSMGWAVGDRGVIWHTQDGGATWTQQSSNVTCRLNSVFFLDAHRGWTVGGESQAHGDSSQGVILRTDNGGKDWAVLPCALLPRIARIKFFNRSQGIAVGDASATQPSGVFVTPDGGDTWQPLPTNSDGGWFTGDFLDPQSGAVAGAAGRFAQLARREIIHPPTELQTIRSLHAMRLLPPTTGWLVGDGGLVLATNDLGHTWQSPTGDVPLTTSHFDFHALAVLGPSVWVAGAPGTRVFHSPDNGQTWQSFPTAQHAPLRSITFIDLDHGWTVGDFGNVLATTDGGRTWKSQRTGGQRAALLGLFADAADVPLEVLATYGAADGYLTAIDILHTSGDPASDDGRPIAPPPTNARHTDALLLSGASTVDTAWRFPLPPGDLAHTPAELLAALNQSTDGRAIEQIEQHLVRSIRTWRPEVVLTQHTNLDSCEPRSAILAAVVMQSLNAAADPTRHVDLANDAGLAPWQVKKVYELLPPGALGAESIAANRFAPLLGASLSNFVSPARQLIGPTKKSPCDRYDFDLLTSTIPGQDGPRGLFSGISLAAGSDARRPPSALPIDDLDSLRRLAERRHQLEALLKRSEGNAAWAAQVDQITQGLNADDGAQLLAQLADGYRATGRLDLAADTFYLLARRYPDHADSARALEWLIQFYASVEMSQRLASRGAHNVRQASLEVPGQVAAATGNLANSTPTIGLSRDDRLHRATQLAEYLRSSKPDLYAEPRVRFAEIAALRQLGFANAAKRYYLTLRQLPETNPWRRCGETETWLARPADLPPPNALGACRPTSERPSLDAQLVELCWQTADHLRLSGTPDNSTDAPPADVRLAYDNEYLYIAITCRIAPNSQPPVLAPPQPRPRDADLSQHDRVTLRFDVDRDFTTAFELTVDSRGWTHDACWGDAHWNPTWYVAVSNDEASWTIEAAISVTDLVDQPPAARHVWAVSATRTIPRVGYQYWASPSPAEDSPDQFGLLIFE